MRAARHFRQALWHSGCALAAPADPTLRSFPSVPLRYGFEGGELHADRRRLILDGRPVRIGGRAFDVLLALVEGAHRVVPKDELYERAWPGMAVEPSNLQVQVWALRKLVGAAAIATVARRGYRFMLDVRRLEDDATAAADPQVDALVRQLQAGRLLTLVGACADERRRTAHAVALRLRPRGGACYLEPPAVERGHATLVRRFDTPPPEGELMVCFDAQAARRGVAALAAQVLARHPASAVLITAAGALGLPGENVATLAARATPERAGVR